MDVTGVIFDLKRFAVHDGPGIRTTVFFKGCPLRCRWCHNPESQRRRPEPMKGVARRACGVRGANGAADEVGREVTVDQLVRELEKDVVFFDESGGGVTFSGGEPLLQHRFLHALLDACRDRALHTAVDTSGYALWAHIEPLYRQVDLFLYDLKLMDDAAHPRTVDVGNGLIKENLRRLHDRGARIVLRVPLIPGITDTDANLSAIARFIAPMEALREVHLLPYNPVGEDKYRRLHRPNTLGRLRTQSEEALAEIKARFNALDVDVKIGG